MGSPLPFEDHVIPSAHQVLSPVLPDQMRHLGLVLFVYVASFTSTFTITYALIVAHPVGASRDPRAFDHFPDKTRRQWLIDRELNGAFGRIVAFQFRL